VSIAPNQPCLEEKKEEFAKIWISRGKSGLPVKNPELPEKIQIFKKPGFTNFHSIYSFYNMKKNNLNTLLASKRSKSRIWIVKNLDF
jgi:hypothetical protein